MSSQPAQSDSADLSRASRLALLSAALGVILGAAALVLGLAEGAIACWGFGAAALLRVPQTLTHRWRLRTGLGNRGLDAERRLLRALGLAFRALGLGVALAAGASIFGRRGPGGNLTTVALAAFAVLLHAALWRGKLRVQAAIPALALGAARTRTLVELALLLLLGTLLGHWFLWADAAAALAMALRLFFEGRALAKLTTLPTACGGCGSGCGCR